MALDEDGSPFRAAVTEYRGDWKFLKDASHGGVFFFNKGQHCDTGRRAGSACLRNGSSLTRWGGLAKSFVIIAWQTKTTS